MTNPFESHPLYRYRRLLLILSAFSFALCLLAITGGSADAYSLHIAAIALSVLLGIYDLVRFALGQTHDASERSHWPEKRVMWGDLFLAFLFFISFIAETTSAASFYYSSVPWYGYTSALSVFCIVIHARCFWKQYMAFKELRWLTQLQKCNSIHQCSPCQQNHNLLHCSGPEVTPPSRPPRVSRRSAPQEDTIPPTFPIPVSWLPACIRPNPDDDIEATAESPNESTRLITPLTDEITVFNGSRDRSQSPENRTDHEESEVVVVKKKSKKKGKKVAVESENEGESSTTQDLLSHGKDF